MVWRVATLKQPVQFSATSNVEIVITFAFLWQNQSNCIFSKMQRKLLKQAKIDVPSATHKEKNLF